MVVILWMIQTYVVVFRSLYSLEVMQLPTTWKPNGATQPEAQVELRVSWSGWNGTFAAKIVNVRIGHSSVPRMDSAKHTMSGVQNFEFRPREWVQTCIITLGTIWNNGYHDSLSIRLLLSRNSFAVDYECEPTRKWVWIAFKILACLKSMSYFFEQTISGTFQLSKSIAYFQLSEKTMVIGLWRMPLFYYLYYQTHT